jgi:hypothetical protein
MQTCIKILKLKCLYYSLLHWCTACFDRYGLHQVLRKLPLNTRIYFEIIFIDGGAPVFNGNFRKHLMMTICVETCVAPVT